ncbi:hypothetical protein PVAP13_2NG284503 [Panicum virgatum]|uniref:Uncharacterized protein n=1 Tax=Panicum virgatum TaxID=38727 RepID=A0A8T0VF41_PANVG|nr:hypothetical protein PVAP13_2NG284503 [Panicum virgatum]
MDAVLFDLTAKVKASISEAELPMNRLLNGMLILMQGSMQESLNSTAASKSANEKRTMHPPPLELLLLLFLRLRTIGASDMWPHGTSQSSLTVGVDFWSEKFSFCSCPSSS